MKWANRNCTTILQRTSQPIIWSTPNVVLAHSASRLWDCHSLYGFHVISMAFQWNSMESRWNAVECHGIPWDTEDCHSLYGFYAISMAFQWNSMASRWNAVEFHGIPWDTENCHSLYGFYAISMAFQWNSMASRWNVVECHGIPWDTENRIILTVEIHGIRDSDKISEWKAMDIGKIGCIIHWNAMK